MPAGLAQQDHENGQLRLYGGCIIRLLATIL
jgi:hypothetical protein